MTITSANSGSVGSQPEKLPKRRAAESRRIGPTCASGGSDLTAVIGLAGIVPHLHYQMHQHPSVFKGIDSHESGYFQ